MKVVKFSHRCISVRLRDLYFVYGIFSTLCIFHGFYMDGNWDRLQLDGNRLVMHVRLYSLLGFGAWLVALWLGAATLSAFGLVETQFIADSSPNLIYLTTLIMCCLRLLISPWLLNTIHKKGSQADEYYCAEFMADLKQQQRRSARPRYEVDDDDDSDHDAESRSRVTPLQDEEHEEEDAVPRRNSRSKSKKRGQKNRKVFYNADGTASVATGPEAVTARSSLQGGTGSPRSAVAPQGDYYGRPVPPSASLELNLQGGVVQEGLLTSSHASNPDQIPFASPVFLLDREPRLQPNDFWWLWKHVETTGSFSCLFTNKPSKRDVDAHLRKFGFHVIGSDAKDNVLQTHFYAYQYGTDLAFLCEFVLVFSRRFFQATFKCKIPSLPWTYAPDVRPPQLAISHHFIASDEAPGQLGVNWIAACTFCILSPLYTNPLASIHHRVAENAVWDTPVLHPSRQDRPAIGCMHHRLQRPGDWSNRRSGAEWTRGFLPEELQILNLARCMPDIQKDTPYESQIVIDSKGTKESRRTRPSITHLMPPRVVAVSETGQMQQSLDTGGIFEREDGRAVSTPTRDGPADRLCQTSFLVRSRGSARLRTKHGRQAHLAGPFTQPATHPQNGAKSSDSRSVSGSPQQTSQCVAATRHALHWPNVDESHTVR
ncbi:Transmembrane protein, partial [Globisporangium splendens]